MTEQEWRALNAGLMLLYLEEGGLISSRKLRLLAVTYARYLVTQPQYADAKPVAHLGEEVAEGRATLQALLDPAVRGWGYSGDWGIAHLVLGTDDQIGRGIRRTMSIGMSGDADPIVAEIVLAQQSAILRPYICCIVGNPFRPVTIKPAWLTPTVNSLAQATYEERALPSGELDPAWLAVLADALEETGCENDDILNHLREPGVHVRGCWVVDSLLGKV